ncbi:hypothetical protein ACWC9T_41590 [Kitasatospora sp. NPDC001159]
MGEDHQLALHLCYELHHRGLPGVHPGWEWEPELLSFRRELERPFLTAVRAEATPVRPLGQALERLLAEPAGGTGPSAPSSTLPPGRGPTSEPRPRHDDPPACRRHVVERPSPA